MDWTTPSQWLSRIDALGASLIVLGALLAALLVLWLGRRLRKPAIVSAVAADASCGLCARLWERVTRLLDAIDYLATRREWRYRQPWVLVLGEHGAGKSSLLASVSRSWHYRPPPHADQLQVNGLHWNYFRHGVLIDTEGALAAADAGSDEAVRWRKALSALDALRPERPLDGILLCVSARTLRETRQSQRTALAENVNRQIGQLQASIEFMLPVYVVVTQCDSIPGFSAFWESHDVPRRAEPAGSAPLSPKPHEGHDLSRRAELVGYSAIPKDQDAEPGAWADTAFDLIGARLRELQVDVAAHREQIGDTDGFFLYPGHFQSLRMPLAQWLETVFRATAWQSGYLFRGMYFTGSVAAAGTHAEGVRTDVNFVDALVAEKVLREPALARPTRQGMWSRNRLIRSLQIGAVAAALGLFVALGFSAQRFSRQVEAVVDGIAALESAMPDSANPATGECWSREEVYPLLADVSRIDTHSRYATIPLSWLDRRLTTRSARVIGRSGIRDVLMPTLACLLEARSRAMLASARDLVPASPPDLAAQRDAFAQLIADVRDLEDNLARYKTLAQRSDALDEAQLIQVLDKLATYVFDAALPKEVLRPGNVLDDAIRNITDVPLPVLPDGLRQRLAAQMLARGSALRTALSREVAMGDILLDALGRGQSPVLDNSRRIATWLAWVQQSWLGSTAERNPCREIVNANQPGVDALIDAYGYDASLSGMLRGFDSTQCHQPEMRVLAAMRIAPYGPLFVPGEGGLMLASALQGELAGMPMLVSLPFMQMSSTRPFECLGTNATWHANEIAEAAGYVDDYEAFAKAQQLPPLPDGGRPLYDRLARQSLAHALDDALRRAQQMPPDASGQAPGLQAVSPGDAQLTQVGGELARGLDSLRKVLDAYVGYGLSNAGADVRQCVRDFAADNLGRVDALADSSRLYAPPAAAGNDVLFELGSLPVAKDFLARQLARAQVLGSYATPFVSLLGDTPGVDDAWRDNPQTAVFWRNTLDEINRYTQGKEPTGQVANLDTYFIGRLAGMSYTDCAEVLAAYTAPDYGNDLFSERRRILERQVQLRCGDQRQAQAAEIYGAMATRFNRDLAGRYPFGEPGARDAGLAVVRAFLRDYAVQHDAIAAALVDLDADHWQSATRFVEQFDAVATFLASNVGAPEQMDGVGLNATFPVAMAGSVGGDQLLRWRLAAEDTESVFPNGLKALDWFPGQQLALELQWAERSDWRPVADPAQADLSIQGATATFKASGPWALLRFIDAHRVRGASDKDSDPVRLALSVPVQALKATTDGKPSRSEARVFMTWQLSGVDPKTQASTPLALPASFPASAPTD